jgi:multidrug efflux pump subunit AcrA (membrane-fusion protein)
VTGKIKDVVLVPTDAVVARGRENFVFIVEGPVAKMIPITLGGSRPGFVQIANGAVKPGDAVVVRGNDLLRETTPVVVTRTVGSEEAAQQ